MLFRSNDTATTEIYTQQDTFPYTTLFRSLTLVPLLALMSLSVASLGILIASRMHSQQGFQLLIQLLILPMIVLSGAFFPLNKAPDWLSIVAKLNPFTYGVDSIRQAFLAHMAGTQAAGAASPLSVAVLGHVMTL